MITVVRVESKLDCWFSAGPPVCSVLWLLGSPALLVPAMVQLSAGLDPVQLAAAAHVRPALRQREAAHVTPKPHIAESE
jgi:hypothetical protein